MLLFINVSRPEPTPVGVVTVMLTVIPAPTETPSPAPTLTPSSITPPTMPPGTLAIGAYVQVVDTGGEGLHLRETPGIDSAHRFLGMDAEIFRIIAGPQDADGYTWWNIVSPHDEARNGWAVSNYLEVVEEP